MMSMMVVAHRSVNETKTEHADNEYAFHWLTYMYTNNCFIFFIVQVAKAVVAENWKFAYAN